MKTSSYDIKHDKKRKGVLIFKDMKQIIIIIIIKWKKEKEKEKQNKQTNKQKKKKKSLITK